jgi:hypothetical protein
VLEKKLHDVVTLAADRGVKCAAVRGNPWFRFVGMGAARQQKLHHFQMTGARGAAKR